MKKYAVYKADGEITRICLCSESSSDLQAGDGEDVAVVPDNTSDATHYIKDGKAVEKASLSPSVEVDGFTATVTGLPAGLEVELDGVTAITDDDPLEIEVDEPGTYKLRIDGGAPYISTTVEITFG